MTDGWKRFAPALLVLGCGYGAAFGATIHVPGDQGTIQAGIDVAVSGVDEVVVAAGTYSEIIDFHGKAITVRSGDPTDAAVVAATVIDATLAADPGTGKPVVRCDSGEGAGTVLSGFTLTGGTGDTFWFATSSGGGMFNRLSNPTVMHCVFSGNTAVDGGGMFSHSSSPTVTHCTFSGNTATGDGGGMYNDGSSPAVTHCWFIGNLAVDGGGDVERQRGSGGDGVRVRFQHGEHERRGDVQLLRHAGGDELHF